MDIKFEGQRALVTGAGKGIGRGVAVKLAECGAKVIAISRTQADLDNLKQEVPSIETHICDLSDWDAARSLVENLGPIDLLVNNAGTNIIDNFVDYKKETLYKLFDINFMAVFNITQVVAKGMIERGRGGAIVMMSSMLALRAMEMRSVYCCTKAAIDQLTRSLALELGPHKIRVNSVNPTVTLTPLAVGFGWESPSKASRITDRTPLGHLAAVDDVVNATVFLLSDKSSMTTGSILTVEGGITTHI